MKRSVASNEAAFLSRVGKGQPLRKPLRTAAEMADELGISFGSFRAHLGKTGAPKPRLSHRSGTTTSHQWYDRDEVLTWWKAIKRSAKTHAEQ